MIDLGPGKRKRYTGPDDLDRLIEFMHEEEVQARDERDSWYRATGMMLRTQADEIERLSAENKRLRSSGTSDT